MLKQKIVSVLSFSNTAISLSLLLSGLIACSRRTTPSAPIIIERTVVEPCLVTPPLKLPYAGRAMYGTDCPDKYICYLVADAAQLSDNVEKLQQRVQDDWVRCGVKEAADVVK